MFLGPITVGGAPRFPALSQNFPNPVHASTRIQYQLPANGNVSIKVYDTTGRLVRTLKDGLEISGFHSVTWDRLGETGNPLASGIYYYRLVTPDFSSTKKLILLR